MRVVCANAIAYELPSDRIQVVRSYPVHSTLNDYIEDAYPLGQNGGKIRGQPKACTMALAIDANDRFISDRPINDRSIGECATGDAAHGSAGLLERLECGRDRGQPRIGG